MLQLPGQNQTTGGSATVGTDQIRPAANLWLASPLPPYLAGSVPFVRKPPVATYFQHLGVRKAPPLALDMYLQVATASAAGE